MSFEFLIFNNFPKLFALGPLNNNNKTASFSQIPWTGTSASKVSSKDLWLIILSQILTCC